MKIVKLGLLCIIASFGVHNVNGLNFGGIRNEKSVEAETLSTAERALIKEFRNENMKRLTDDYLRSDSFIVGLLRANRWNKVNASKYLQKILKWRAINKVQALEQESIDPELFKYLPYVIEGMTKQGCPVIRVEFGEWRIAEYMRGQQYFFNANKAFRRYFSVILEKCYKIVKNGLPQCDQGIGLVDLKNFTMANIADLNFLSSAVYIVTTFETYYPNLLQSAIVLNSSAQFATFFNTIKYFMPQTLKAVSLYRKEEIEKARQHILSLIDADQLPPRYFGNKTSINNV